MGDRRHQRCNGHEIAWTRSSGSAHDCDRQDLARLVPAVASNAAAEESAPASIVVIEKRALVRECITRCLKSVSGENAISFPSVESWLEISDKISACLILLCIGSNLNDAAQREISLLSQSANGLPMILLSDVDDLNQVVEALNRGARGYIPTSVPLEVAIEAIRLVRAGGIFVPASSLMAARRSADCPATSMPAGNGLFTTRQAAVVEALRRGKANKIIAYELNMRESTVKVHVRNIMKKLKATNRTEVAFMTNELLHRAADRVVAGSGMRSDFDTGNSSVRDKIPMR